MIVPALTQPKQKTLEISWVRFPSLCSGRIDRVLLYVSYGYFLDIFIITMIHTDIYLTFSVHYYYILLRERTKKLRSIYILPHYSVHLIRKRETQSPDNRFMTCIKRLILKSSLMYLLWYLYCTILILLYNNLLYPVHIQIGFFAPYVSP